MNLGKILVGGIASALLSSALLAGVSGAHWGYTGHEGPEHWSELDPNFFMCKAGSNQSPINITSKVTVSVKDLEKIKFDYKTQGTSLLNNGHTIQLNIEDGSTINIDGITFTLKQLHFHTPSENQIEAKHFPLEGHFVHASQDGKLAVVAVMFEDGLENALIKKVWAAMPRKANNTNPVKISADEINAFLPKNKDYYRFDGSLTTPPCSEGVRWFVLQNYSNVSKSQVKEFLDVLHQTDNRPIQPINARKVLK